MVRIYFLVKIIALNSLLLLVGCIGHTPTKREMVGVWKSDKGGVLILNEDNSFSIQNVTTPIFDNLSGQAINGHGKWFLVKRRGNIEIEIHCQSYFIDGIEKMKGYGSHFSIVGSNWIGNKPPWKIYTSTVWYDWQEDDYTVFKKIE